MMMKKRVDFLLYALLCLLTVLVRDVPAGESAERCARGGMVVSACPLASEVGAEVLRAGGNAVDATVAVGFALAVTYPVAGNIGGGGFSLIRMNTGETVCIDCREKAPHRASRDMYVGGDGAVVAGLSTLGHLASGVPGTVAGLYLAHGRFGTLPWRDLIAPAIRLAREGFAVNARLARSLETLEPYLRDYPALCVYFRPDRSPLEPGDTLRQPDLAGTLERIALLGADGFYRGATADLICREMERGQGLIDARDLEEYEAVMREPVVGSYRGREIISAPPPSSGGALLIEILNILEGFPLDRWGFMSEESVHHIVEAEKRAYRDRASYLGDPDFTNNNVNNLIAKDYATYLRSYITYTATAATDLDGGGIPPGESEQTTHYSIVDTWRNVVSTTTTLNDHYGSKVLVEGAGFILNNEMDDFSLKPGVPNMYGLTGGEANAIEPGKRMLSSMSPTIVLEGGEPVLVLGTPGGATIITTVAQVIMNIVDFQMSAREAVHAPRFHHQWVPDKIDYEPGAFTVELMSALEGRGHRCHERSTDIGDVQLIRISGGEVCGIPDPRGGGRAVADTVPSVPQP